MITKRAAIKWWTYLSVEKNLLSYKYFINTIKHIKEKITLPRIINNTDFLMCTSKIQYVHFENKKNEMFEFPYGEEYVWSLLFFWVQFKIRTLVLKRVLFFLRYGGNSLRYARNFMQSYYLFY